MKKLFLILLCLLQICSLTGCIAEGEPNNSSSETSSSAKPVIPSGALQVDLLGIAMVLPDSMREQIDQVLLTSAAGDCVRQDVEIYGQLFLLYQSQEVYDRLMELSERGEELSNEEYAVISKQVKRVCAVTNMDQKTLDEYLKSSQDLQPVTGFQHNVLLQTIDQYAFYFSWDDGDFSNLSESSKKQYEEILSLLPQVQEQVICYQPIQE